MRWTLTFFSVLSAFCAARFVHATDKIWIDVPASCHGNQPCSFAWGEKDGGTGPTLAEMGLCNISLAHGEGPQFDQNFVQLDISHPGSYSFTPDTGVGPDGTYFITFSSVQQKADPSDPNSPPYLVYSGFFQLDGMSGSQFDPSKKAFTIPSATSTGTPTPAASGTASLPTAVTDTGTDSDPTSSPSATDTGTDSDPTSSPTATDTGTDSDPTSSPSATDTGTDSDPTSLPTANDTSTGSGDHSAKRSMERRAPIWRGPQEGGAVGIPREAGLAAGLVVFELILTL